VRAEQPAPAFQPAPCEGVPLDLQGRHAQPTSLHESCGALQRLDLQSCSWLHQFRRRAAQSGNGPPARHSAAKNSVDSREQQVDFRACKFANTLYEICLIEREHLRYICHRIPGKPCRSCCQDSIAGRIRPDHVAGEGHAHDCCYFASVHGVTLHHHDWSTESGRRPVRKTEICPPHLTLRDHHSVFSRRRRAAVRTNVSL
jgi:hypothetical protein